MLLGRLSEKRSCRSRKVFQWFSTPAGLPQGPCQPTAAPRGLQEFRAPSKSLQEKEALQVTIPRCCCSSLLLLGLTAQVQGALAGRGGRGGLTCPQELGWWGAVWAGAVCPWLTRSTHWRKQGRASSLRGAAQPCLAGVPRVLQARPGQALRGALGCRGSAPCGRRGRLAAVLLQAFCSNLVVGQGTAKSAKRMGPGPGRPPPRRRQSRIMQPRLSQHIHVPRPISCAPLGYSGHGRATDSARRVSTLRGQEGRRQSGPAEA